MRSSGGLLAGFGEVRFGAEAGWVWRPGSDGAGTSKALKGFVNPIVATDPAPLPRLPTASNRSLPLITGCLNPDPIGLG